MKKIRSMGERIRLCEEWRQSGLKKSEFCILNKLSRSNFYKWLKEIRVNNKPPEAVITTNNEASIKAKEKPIGFIKIPELPNVGMDAGCLEIILPNGINCKAKLTANNVDNFLERLLIWK